MILPRHNFHPYVLIELREKNNKALELFLDVPNIDVNIVNNIGESALHAAVFWGDIEGLKLLLNVPGIDVNILDKNGQSVSHCSVDIGDIEGLKLLLSHPSLTALTLNQKDKWGDTPVMLAVRRNRLKQLELLAADLRVDLDTTDKWGKSLEEVARWAFLVAFLFNSQHHVVWGDGSALYRVTQKIRHIVFCS